jgi:hypothetical protein
MHKILMLISFVVGMTVVQFSADAAVGNSLEINQKLASERMQTLRVMISKLRDLVYNLRDINQLEEIGMPRQDVLLMKNALQQKINQTQQETVAFIRRF